MTRGCVTGYFISMIHHNYQYAHSQFTHSFISLMGLNLLGLCGVIGRLQWNASVVQLADMSRTDVTHMQVSIEGSETLPNFS